MAGFTDLLGGLLQQGLSKSSVDRISNALGGDLGQSLENMVGKLTGSADGTAAASGVSDQTQSGGAGDLGSMLSGALGSLAGNKALAGGIGALAGALLGGGSKSARGAIGGGGLAVLASMAMSALQKAGQAPAQTPSALVETPGEAEQQGLEADAETIVRAMLNAAKADGRIGPKEVERILGKLNEDGLSQQEKDFLTAEAQKPMDLAAVIASARGDAQMAAQIYAASALAIEVDTVAEKDYMRELAAGLGLHPEVVAHIERTLGLA